MPMIQWVLASSSPRRRELLKLLLPDFEVLASDVDEVIQPGEWPEALVKRLAHEKALAVQRCRPAACIIGADTSVVCELDILGKPASAEEAKSMLWRLSGRTHQVLTGVCLLHRETCLVECSTTDVTFCSLSEQEIERYLKSGEPFDKAGAYATQGLGARFVERIDGCHFNVVGLPVSRVYQMMKRLELEVPWKQSS
ncbi:MAG: Maf family protein [Acidobacteriales bacterium]|nr:Maf family protein [Terriglobales bacterium]MCI0622891.1 Maf family protein [Acidobacteriota bacterium]MCI0720716.1 Maf family protein [Acidobacteriota bacterium]